MSDASKPLNRLSKEASPYLRQHERNPVDWYPWGPEALARAKSEDKPILLSIGYSACHWCHVMAHESFEDESIARTMNALFVNVKVDREERPDLDQIYQLTVQLMGRSGGWPLTVFLTPDQKPFFAGTYFPAVDRYGMPGFPKILEAVADAYKTKRGDVEVQASEITGAIARVVQLETRGDGEPFVLGADLLEQATKAMARRFDDDNGGFGARPKFPNSMALDVLLRRSVETTPHDAQSERRVRHALMSMRRGGIWDHLGGGFHRYSTDERWLVPHFEKMLYDNALLARLYVDASRAYADPRLAHVSLEILRYLEREMIDGDGAFFCTQDADSVPEGAPAAAHPEEGAFFVWTPEEVSAACGDDEDAASAARKHFGVTARGNFDSHGGDTPPPGPHAHDPSVRRTVLSEVVALETDEERAALDRAMKKMFDRREHRPKPFRDEKVLASWNGLAIGACAEVAMATGDARVRTMAERAFAAVEAKLVDASGRVKRSNSIAGYLDDHSFLACAALDLYELTGTPRYVGVARSIVNQAIAHFADDAPAATGSSACEMRGFFFTADDGEALLHRAKEPFDQAIPSGQSMMALALLRLFALDGTPALEERAKRTIEPLAAAASRNPLGFSETIVALDRLVRGSTDVVVVGRRNDLKTVALIEAVHRAYVAHRTLAFVDPDDAATSAACPALAEGKPAKDHPVAYVCRGRTCSPPIADPTALAAAITCPS
jgi:uncharacterized protein YyaL (SSP411 family)